MLIRRSRSCAEPVHDLSAIRSGHSFCELGNVILGKIEGLRLPKDDHHLGTVRQGRVQLYMTVSNAPTNDIHEPKVARDSPQSGTRAGQKRLQNVLRAADSLKKRRPPEP